MAKEAVILHDKFLRDYYHYYANAIFCRGYCVSCCGDLGAVVQLLQVGRRFVILVFLQAFPKTSLLTPPLRFQQNLMELGLVFQRGLLMRTWDSGAPVNHSSHPLRG